MLSESTLGLIGDDVHVDAIHIPALKRSVKNTYRPTR